MDIQFLFQDDGSYRYISGYSGTTILRNSKDISIKTYQNWCRDMFKWKLIC